MMTPTIGRKVWYWPLAVEIAAVVHVLEGSGGLDPMEYAQSRQPWDATVVFVYDNGNVNVLVTDWIGNQTLRLDRNLSANDTDQGHCTWMPYQVAQAAKGV